MSGWSSHGMQSVGSNGEEVDELMDDPFEAAIEGLYEKRTSTREASLARLASLLSTEWRYEDCALREETIFSLALRAARRGKGEEARLGARLLGLHVLTLGAGPAAERMWAEALPALESTALTGRGPERCAVIDTLAMLCFVGAEGVPDTLGAMALLERVYSSRGCAEAAAAAALRGWTLLLTCVPPGALDVGWVESRLAELGELLHASSVSVRGAAGEALSLLFHTCDLASLAGEGPAAAGPVTPPLSPGAATMSPGFVARPPRPRPPGVVSRNAQDSPRVSGAVSSEGRESESLQNGSSQGTEPGPGVETGVGTYSAAAVETLEDITSRIQDLTVNRGDATRRSQKERAELRSTFRAILNAIEGESTLPAQKIKLRHGDVLVVEELPAVLRLNAFRRFLAEGFQVHLQDNPLLHEVFNYQPRVEARDKLTPLEKRLYRSPASAESKARSVDRRRERAVMASYKGAMLAAD